MASLPLAEMMFLNTAGSPDDNDPLKPIIFLPTASLMNTPLKELPIGAFPFLSKPIILPDTQMSDVFLICIPWLLSVIRLPSLASLVPSPFVPM